jgi:predicted CXXCH cytochrome family protein
MKSCLLLLSVLVWQTAVAVVAADGQTINHAQKADTAKKCSICHYRWVYTFYVEHRPTPIAPLQEKKVEGEQRMCLSCHDGSVRDSRDRICNDPGHRVGVKPSAAIRIPENFPLDEQGGLLCVTCHTPHALTKDDDRLVEFFLRAPNTNSSLCQQCHITRGGGKTQGNHPIGIAAPSNPEPIIEAGGRMGTERPYQIICETCHIPHGGVNNKFLVLSAEDPRTRSVLCEVCHTAKPGLAADASLNRFSHPMDLTADSRVSIPKKWKGGGAVVLGSGGELVCRTCHIPHGAADKDYLLAERNQQDSLCVQCHAAQRGIADASHYRKVISRDERNIKGQAASALGPCSSCHLVHQGTDELMWARRVPKPSAPPGESCKSCHSPEGEAKEVVPAPFSHPMNSAASIAGRSSVLPLFDKEGKNQEGEIRCSTCHDFHNPHPLRPAPSEASETRSTYLRLSADGPSAICLECHPAQGLIKGTDHDLGVTAPDVIATLERPPAPGNLCGFCHMVHNQKPLPYLWSAPLGPSVIEGWDKTDAVMNDMMVMFCTGCHAPGKVAQSAIPRFGLHPREKTAAGMPAVAMKEAAGDKFPLFMETGENKGGGHIVCATCHNPHQWDPRVDAQGSGKNSEGNVATSFLRPNLAAEFCSRCHGEETLVKFTYFHSPLSRKTGN